LRRRARRNAKASQGAVMCVELYKGCEENRRLTQKGKEEEEVDEAGAGKRLGVYGGRSENARSPARRSDAMNVLLEQERVKTTSQESRVGQGEGMEILLTRSAEGPAMGERGYAQGGTVVQIENAGLRKVRKGKILAKGGEGVVKQERRGVSVRKVPESSGSIYTVGGKLQKAFKRECWRSNN